MQNTNEVCSWNPKADKVGKLESNLVTWEFDLYWKGIMWSCDMTYVLCPHHYKIIVLARPESHSMLCNGQ